MIASVKKALNTPEIRKRLLFMLIALIIIRIGSQIPVPGLNSEALRAWIGNDTSVFGLLDLFSGGSLANMSLFAVSITPYITASIIIELLTVVIPRLKEMSEEGEDGRKKKANITKFLGIGLSALQAIGLVLTFMNRGLIADASPVQMITAIMAMVAGSAFLIWLADRITEKGFGNGMSFILLVNIVSRIPAMIQTLYLQFIKDATLPNAILTICLIVAIILVIIILVVILEGGIRNIPVTHSSKITGRRSPLANETNMPLKVNMAGVIPIIFAQTIMSLPALIRMFAGNNSSGWLGEFANMLDQNNWFSAAVPWYTIGFVIQLALIFFFAYFYTGIIFDPTKTAHDLKKRGSMIPGIRPGKPTADYLANVSKSLIFIGATGLIIVTTIPMLATGIAHANIAFGGTSVIIVAGVILEIVRQIDSELVTHHHSGFLSRKE